MSVTVIIASYRYGHLAAHCIESILAQSRTPDKVLFVDDAAGDCYGLSKLYPEVEFVFREKNLGVVENFDDMLQRVETEKCMFIGADNWLRSDAIEILMHQKTDIVTYDIVLTGTLKHDTARWHTSEIINYQGDYYWSRTMKHHGSMLYNARLAKQFGYRKRERDNSHTEEDWYLWDRMIDAGATVSHVAQGLLFYRKHRENFNKD
jgi:glycosyltransferase involved in cell wall biosynthesis